MRAFQMWDHFSFQAMFLAGVRPASPPAQERELLRLSVPSPLWEEPLQAACCGQNGTGAVHVRMAPNSSQDTPTHYINDGVTRKLQGRIGLG
mgnify:CR=1 FL=1